MILLITVLALNLLIYLVIISKMTKLRIVNSFFFFKKVVLWSCCRILLVKYGMY